jgi:hypothetical protein
LATDALDGSPPRLTPLFQPGDEMSVAGEGQAELGAADFGGEPIARDLVQQGVDVGVSFHGLSKITRNCSLSIIADLPTVRRMLKLTTRERLIFELLKRHEIIGGDEILKHLDDQGVGLLAQRATHSLVSVVKNLTMKVSQDGWIITMIDGGRGAGNKATYSMKKRF